MRTVQVDGTAWPVDVPEDPNEDSVEWRLRYAPESLTHSELLFAASVMGAYRGLLNPIYSQADAFAMLKRARQARIGPDGGGG